MPKSRADKTNTKTDIKQRFTKIQEKHHELIKEQGATLLKSLLGTNATSLVVKNYLDKIGSFHKLPETKSAMKEAISGPTLAQKLKAGSITAMVGGLVAGGVFVGEQKAGSKDLLGLGTVAQAGAAAGIGVSMSALLYAGWAASEDKPGSKEVKDLKESMKLDGFNEKYNELSDDLVKLFHFRESLLLNLAEGKHRRLRDQFITKHFDKKSFDLELFKIAVEVYFLQALEKFFEEAFEKIYTLHENEIQGKDQPSKFLNWLKKHCRTPKEKRKFTQQMQLDFMTQCLSFFERELAEKSFMGRHPYFISSIMGLTAGFTLTTLLAVFLPMIPIGGLVGIGICLVVFTAVGVYYALDKIDALHFKRDTENRTAIKGDIEKVSGRRDQLQKIVDRIVQTSVKEIKYLKQLNGRNKADFATALKLRAPKQTAMGADGAWFREYKNRFVESELVEDDLKEVIQDIILESKLQTPKYRQILMDAMATGSSHGKEKDHSHSRAEALKLLENFIQDTQKYLQDPENSEYKKTFELIQKIKEQILEIVSSLPATLTHSELPAVLVDYYTRPIEQGGLGGVAYELTQVRTLAPDVPITLATDEPHPYRILIETALCINDKLNQYEAPLILRGDRQYRKMLGLPNYEAKPVLDANNIQDYLNNSFDFLCSLNHYQVDLAWDKPVQHTPEFMLFRMLLVSQLANLCDPNTIEVDDYVQNEIKKFAQEKLNYYPDMAFDDIANHSVLFQIEPGDTDNSQPTIKNAIDKECKIAQLAYVAEAIRIDLAYVSTELSRQNLMDAALQEFAKKADNNAVPTNNKTILTDNKAIVDDNKIILTDKEAPSNPENTLAFLAAVNKSIRDTTDFLQSIKNQDLLKKTNTIVMYNQVLSSSIDELSQKIAKLKTRLKAPPLTLLEASLINLNQALNALAIFKQAIPVIEYIAPPAAPIQPRNTAHQPNDESEQTPQGRQVEPQAGPADPAPSALSIIVEHTDTSIGSTASKEPHAEHIPADFPSDANGRTDDSAPPSSSHEREHDKSHHVLERIEHALDHLNPFSHHDHKNKKDPTVPPEASHQSDTPLRQEIPLASAATAETILPANPSGFAEDHGHTPTHNKHRIETVKNDPPSSNTEGARTQDLASGHNAETVTHTAKPEQASGMNPHTANKSPAATPIRPSHMPEIRFHKPAKSPLEDQDQILGAFCEALEGYITVETGKRDKETSSSGGLFHRKAVKETELGKGHTHTRQQKIEAARALQKVLKKEINPAEEPLFQSPKNEVFESKHLKEIIEKYLPQLGKKSLAELFTSTEQVERTTSTV